MPLDTPGGYTYPEYSDTQNFPAQIQDLAEDIDADVQDLYDDVNNALNAPTAAVEFSGLFVLASGVTTPLPFDSQQYDNAAMWAPGTPTEVTIVQTGIYMITGWAQFNANGVATNSVGVFIMSNGALVNLVTVTRAPDNDKSTEISATCIVFLTAGDDVTLNLRQTTGAPMDVVFAQMTVTKVST